MWCCPSSVQGGVNLPAGLRMLEQPWRTRLTGKAVRPVRAGASVRGLSCSVGAGSAALSCLGHLVGPLTGFLQQEGLGPCGPFIPRIWGAFRRQPFETSSPGVIRR